jgi:glycosyltransferase involved in cell wall biosynthesis
MKRPLVSVLTPCFNSEEYIASCIESVLAQDYPRVEHIVQDGASRDGTADILRSYTGRIEWVSMQDRGQADGLNKALQRCKGDILLVLNADDELLPSAAAWGVRQMTAFPDAAVVYGDMRLIDAEGNESGTFTAPEYDFAGVLCVEKVIGAQAAFIRRSMFEQVGLWADDGLDTCPDYEMFVRIGLKFPMRHVPGLVARYRYYRRSMDGASPRSIGRFVRAKTSVMERVFRDPNTPKDVARLRRRAKAGLFLWASQEARGMGDIREGWHYYGKALLEFPVVGWLIGKAILTYVGWRDSQQRRRRISYAPNLRRAMFVGAGLAQQTRGFSLGFSFLYGIRKFLLVILPGFFKGLFSRLPEVLQTLTTLGLLVLLSYLIFLMTQQNR